MINYKISQPISRKQGELQLITGQVGSSLQDTINGRIEIKSFGLYDTFQTNFKKLVNLSLTKLIEITRIECLWGAIEITASIGVQIGTVFICL